MIPKNIRIKDIAKMAGVSEGTVDRVLHNRGKVSSKALLKVNDVLKKIHYRPNLIARSLGKGKNHRIAVIISDPKLEPYWAEVQLGILQAQEEWVQYGITIDTYHYVHDGNLSFDHIADKALKSKPDGVVLAPLYYVQALPVLKLIHDQKIPYVLFNTNIPEAKPLSFIGQDLFQSGMLAGQLMSLGQEKNERLIILNLGDDVEDSVYLKEKERGFREFYKKNIPQSHTIDKLNFDHNKTSFNHQIETLTKDKSIKGIFVTTSRTLSTIASILSKQSRKDIRLIGYDMLEDNLKYLKEGAIRFLINQNPKRQSFLGISHMANHLLFKKKVPAIDLFPLEIITQQNVDSYIASGIH
jgi:LacI family transcriptional regulator